MNTSITTLKPPVVTGRHRGRRSRHDTAACYLLPTPGHPCEYVGKRRNGTMLIGHR